MKILATILLLFTINTMAAEDHPIHKVPVPIPSEAFPTIIAFAYQSAMEITGYDRNDFVKPGITVIPDSVMSQILKVPNNNQAYALYSYETNTIYINETSHKIPPILTAGLLVHEFVHYLQFANGVDFTICQQRKAAEVEAYKVQDMFLRKMGFPVNWQWPNLGMCEQEIDQSYTVNF